MRDEHKAEIARLLRGQRWAALATLREGAPFASMVAYVPEQDFTGFLLHLSHLSAHTRNLMADPRASLVVSEPDGGRGDPQTLARLTVLGRVEQLSKGSSRYDASRRLYIERLPDSEMLFGFGDFTLFRLAAEEARYVGGFGRAFSLSSAQLREVAG